MSFIAEDLLNTRLITPFCLTQQLKDDSECRVYLFLIWHEYLTLTVDPKDVHLILLVLQYILLHTDFGHQLKLQASLEIVRRYACEIRTCCFSQVFFLSCRRRETFSASNPFRLRAFTLRAPFMKDSDKRSEEHAFRPFPRIHLAASHREFYIQHVIEDGRVIRASRGVVGWWLSKQARLMGWSPDWRHCFRPVGLFFCSLTHGSVSSKRCHSLLK